MSEQPNPYITPAVCFQFRYFALRNMHVLLRAQALVGRAFWDRLINWSMLIEEGLIDPEDLRLFHYAETGREAWEIIAANHRVASPA